MRTFPPWLCFASLVLAPCAMALESDVFISQYGHASWRIQDGLFAGAPTAVTQTRDGYIWVATRSGLQRFDGVRFVEFAPTPGDEPLRSPRIISLIAARDGSLWIGTGADIEHWDGRHLTHYPHTPGLAFARIHHIVEDRSGIIWFVRSGSTDPAGPLCKIVNETPVCFGQEYGLPFQHSGGFLLEDPSGSLWLNSDDQLFRWDGHSSTAIPTGLAGKNVVDAIQTLAFDIDGSLLVGAEQTSRGLGLSRLRNGKLEPYLSHGLDGRRLGVQTLFVDSHRALWIGTLGEGVYRIFGDRVEQFRLRDGLTSDTVSNFFEDSEGNIWISTTQGLDRFRNLRVVSYSSREGLTFDSVHNVAASKSGAIWIGNWRSLDRLENNKVTSLKADTGLPGEEVTALLEDHTGRLWVGIDGGLTYLENNRFTRLRRDDGSDIGVVNVLSENTHGEIWVMSEQNPESLVRLRDFKIAEEIPRSQMKFAISKALAADRGQGVWVATYEGNLAHWHDGHYDLIDFGRPAHTTHIDSLIVLADGSVIGASAAGVVGWHEGRALIMTESNGLPCRHIWALQQDAQENLWMYAECGLLRVLKNDIYRWFADANSRLPVLHLDSWDGVQPARAAWGPLSALSRDGKLWFANDTILQMFDPARVEQPLASPPVHIESMRVDRKSFPIGSALSLPPRARDVEIDYTAPSFAIPQKVQFRYKLEGHDTDWVNAGARRQALYADLSPGRYRFDVSASGPDGNWGPESASMLISVQPAFYQTKTFLIVCAAAIVGILWLAYSLRVRQLRLQMQGRLDAALKERERIARDLHDSFFQSIQGLLLRFNTGATTMSRSDPARLIFLEALDKSDEVMREGRELVFELRPDSSRATLHEALDMFARNHGRRSAATVSIDDFGDPTPLHPMVFEELLRIGREALVNAFQHSNATKIAVEIHYGSSGLALCVRDNGTGIEDAVVRVGQRPYHYGLPSMRERAAKLGGSFSIKRTSTWSTEVEVRIPAEVAYGIRRGFWSR